MYHIFNFAINAIISVLNLLSGDLEAAGWCKRSHTSTISSFPGVRARGLGLPLPECCMDADGLFMGEATLRKIRCLQETLRGVAGGAALSESLLQVDRVLLRPSPLLQDKGLGFHLVRHRSTHTHSQARTSQLSSVSSGTGSCLQTVWADETAKGKHAGVSLWLKLLLMKPAAAMEVVTGPPHMLRRMHSQAIIVKQGCSG